MRDLSRCMNSSAEGNEECRDPNSKSFICEDYYWIAKIRLLLETTLAIFGPQNVSSLCLVLKLYSYSRKKAAPF